MSAQEYLNGGFSETLALGFGSPAIDNGNPNGCTDSKGNTFTEDQRRTGHAREMDGNYDGVARCDIGAFEALGKGPDF